MNEVELMADAIFNMISNRIENAEPQETIMTVLKEHEGKRLTKRHADALNAASPQYEFRIAKQYGMTHITWTETNSGPSGELLISYNDKNVTIDTAEIRERNPSLFEGRERRNTDRNQQLKNTEKIKELASCIVLYNRTKSQLEDLMDYFSQDKYSIEKTYVE